MIYAQIKDCFADNGILATIKTVDNEKLTALIGNVSDSDIEMLDRYIDSKIEDCYISPILSKIFNYTSLTSQEKQQESIKTFLYIKYDDLLKVKIALSETISTATGTTTTENKHSISDIKNSISSFNSETLENDTANNGEVTQENTTTVLKDDTEKKIKNIETYSDFYRKSFIDKMIDFMKDIFTLQVID